MKAVLVIYFLTGPMYGVAMQVTDPIDRFDCDEMALILNSYTVDAEYFCEDAGHTP